MDTSPRAQVVHSCSFYTLISTIEYDNILDYPRLSPLGCLTVTGHGNTSLFVPRNRE